MPICPRKLTKRIRKRKRTVTTHTTPRASERTSRSKLRRHQILHGSSAQVSCPLRVKRGVILSVGLRRVVMHEAENSMSVQNVAIVFGPTLFSQAQPGVNGQMNGMADAPLQNKVRTEPLPHSECSELTSFPRGSRLSRRFWSTIRTSSWMRVRRRESPAYTRIPPRTSAERRYPILPRLCVRRAPCGLNARVHRPGYHPPHIY